MHLQYIITSFLFTMSCACAMDLQMVTFKAKKKENFFNILPSELRNRITEDVFHFIIDEDEDLKKCFDCRKWEQHVLHVPLLLGMKFIQEFYQLQRMCQREIGFKKFSARQLFVLPREQKDIFIRMAKRSEVKSFIEGNIDVNDFKTLMAVENEDIKKGLKLLTYHKGKVWLYTLFGLVVAIFQFFPMVLILPQFGRGNIVEKAIGYASAVSCFSGIFLLPILMYFTDDKVIEERYDRG